MTRQTITGAPGSTADAGPAHAGGPPPVVVPPAEQALLLGLARVAVAVAAGARPGTALDEALDEALAAVSLPDRRAGAFVTLLENGELRGCMGNLDADNPAWASVIEAARWAARGDPRFMGVEPGELDALEIDVSILGPMQRLADPAAFRPGIDGIVVRRGGRRGLLLPEVADSVGRGPTDMLVACCRKAGLPGDAWHDRGTELWVFRTHRFGGPAT
jgi:AmmeMemoRadiSam system protein A